VPDPAEVAELKALPNLTTLLIHRADAQDLAALQSDLPSIRVMSQ
jgi:hypothetical protein